MVELRIYMSNFLSVFFVGLSVSLSVQAGGLCEVTKIRKKKHLARSLSVPLVQVDTLLSAQY